MDELEVLRMRDEVLPALYWMAAEGLTDAPTLDELARFLVVAEGQLDPYLVTFAERGWLTREGGGHRLTAAGVDLGKSAFAAEFAELTGPTHGECDASCWCHSSPEEARRCIEERAGHAH